MNIEIKINCPDPEKDLHIPYLTWGPAICHIRVRGNSGNKTLYLRTRNLGIGRAVFTDAKREKVYSITTLTCVDETWTTFYLAGDFGYASTRDKDIELRVFQDNPDNLPTAEPVATEALMVRVRKDAETLTNDERDRFLTAFYRLRQKHGGEFYKNFTNMHVSQTDNEIHFYENFLPWHRLYLLNLERDLQHIDPSVSLHYWRWDFPAPNLFSKNFAGKMQIIDGGLEAIASAAAKANEKAQENAKAAAKAAEEAAGTAAAEAAEAAAKAAAQAAEEAQAKADAAEKAADAAQDAMPLPTFSLTNPWRYWKPTESAQLHRLAFKWDLRLNGGWSVLIDRKAPEEYAIQMGKGIYRDLFWDHEDVWDQEGKRKRGKIPGYVFSKPHGSGHMSFRGQISVIATAPEDPVFFMLHSNVDRLWAVWQNHWDRFDPQDGNSYSPQGLSPNRTAGFGAYSKETQWPWNGDEQSPRPQDEDGQPPRVKPAPYGEYPTVKKGYDVLPKPTSQPIIEEVIDYKGRLDPNNSIGFDYDNVPFHFTASPSISLETMDTNQHIQQILDKSLDSQVRLTALDAVTEQSEGLNNLVNIITDKQEPADVRSRVVRHLTSALGHQEKFVNDLMNILTDPSEPAELRKTAIHQIRVLDIEGIAFGKFRSIVLEGLRKVIRDKNKYIAREAIDLLAYQKDEWLQRELKEGLENADKAIVSAESAIYYLSFDTHSFLDVFRKVAEESADEKSKIMAIRALSADTSSADFLVSIFEDKNQSSEVREASAHALDAQNPDLFLAKSVEAFKDEEEQDHQLLTVLLSKLTLQEEEGLDKIRQDGELMDKIRQQAERPQLLKAGAEGSEPGQDDFNILLKRLNSLL